jgi:hypothetical protein
MDHTLSDGSNMRLISAKALVALPVWKGNRIIDGAHVAALKASIGADIKRLDQAPYRTVIYTEEDAGGIVRDNIVLVDGQHRQAVLKDYFTNTMCAPDFELVVVEKRVAGEEDIIEYFNMLNNVKAITWTEPVMIINTYISALQSEFNKGKEKLIRSGATRRPYLSAEALRSALEKNVSRLKGGKTHVAAFVARVRAWNSARLGEVDVALTLGVERDADMTARAAKQKFMLAVNPRLTWIGECLADS